MKERKNYKKQELHETQKNAIKLIKPIFEKYRAISEENGIMKEEVLAEVKNNGAKLLFNNLVSIGIIKKHNGKYYYSEEGEKKPKLKNSNKITWILTIIVFIIFLLILAIIVNQKNIKAERIIEENNEDIRFSIDNKWNMLQEYTEEYGWNYYKYISNTGNIEELINLINNQTVNYTDYPATINITYNKSTEIIENIEELKSQIEKDISESEEEGKQAYNIEIKKSNKGYDILKIETQKTNEPKSISYIYYILNSDSKKLAYICGTSYLLEDSQEIKEEVNKIMNSFYWK